MQNQPPKIDFVITWVDGSDPKWLAEKLKTLQKTANKNEVIDQTDLRFRNDFDFLRYWFRGVEKFAPWVNRIFFVTYGHLPKWLNTHHPKLKIIRHQDFIPEKYLPTFNSHTIENNLHRIKELSEYFVYFNDDFYLLKKTQPSDFFAKAKTKTQNCDGRGIAEKNKQASGEIILPRAFFAENLLINNPSRDIFPYIQMNNMALINQVFNKRDFYKQHFSKAYNLKNGSFNLRNLLLSPWREFSLIYDPHCATSYLKSTFSKMWQKAPEVLNQTCSRPFRSDRDISHLVFYYSQLLHGQFIPRSAKFSHHTMLSMDEVQNQKIMEMILKQKYHLLCINDGAVKKSTRARKALEQAFDSILPEQSQFEKI